jgi:ligand-binding SRPBCC domain-containing protein
MTAGRSTASMATEAHRTGRLLRYRHRFVVDAALARVADFHARSDSMAAITPPGIVVVLRRAPAVLGEGDEMRFTLRLGGLLPVDWTARISDVSEGGFVDTQLEGPFDQWRHEHRFVAEGPHRTRIEDLVEARLRRHWLWLPVGLAMWLGMPLLFAYRALITRRILRNRTA